MFTPEPVSVSVTLPPASWNMEVPFGSASTEGALIAMVGGWMSVARMNRFSRPEPVTDATSTKYVLPASVTKSTLDAPPARLPRSQRMMLPWAIDPSKIAIAVW